MKMKIDEIKVKVKIVEEEQMRAIVGLDFGEFVIKGFRIRKSEHENARGEKLWLTPPSYKGAYKWHPIFFVPDKELWAKLEDKIMSEYKKVSDAYHKKKYGITGDYDL